MDTSKTEPTDQKPIGRRLNFSRRIQQSGIAPSVVAALLLITAALAFIAGTKADDYGLIGGALKSSNNEVLPDDLLYSSVEQLYDKLKVTYDGQLDEQSILDGIKKGLAESTGDPYTTYLNADQAKAFTDDLNGTFSGIGAEIGKEGEFVIIVAPLEGFPAETAGLESGDIILEIDGAEAAGLSIEEAVLLIRGEKGTEVVLTVFREQQQLEIAVVRDQITIPSVSSEVLDDNIGYLRISRFAEDTRRLSDEAARDFKSQGVEKIILDLRNNSGGFLNSAIDVASLWVDGEVVTAQREDEGRKTTNEYRAGSGALLGGFESVVLINGGSASASEIVAGALQDYELASLIGETTFGKGSIQNLEELRDGGVLKVTVARWYTPDGNNIDGDGIAPDLSVELIENTEDDETDEQLQAAIELLTD